MNKGKAIYCLFLILLFSTIGPGAALAKISDVPVDHWAYQAVNTAVSGDYMSVFDDGSFQGSQAVDRYTLARTIGQLLKEIAAAQFKGVVGDEGQIREISLQFQKDLADLYADYAEVQLSLEKLKKDAVVAAGTLGRVSDGQVKLEDRVEELAVLQARFEGLENSVGELQDELAALRTDQRIKFDLHSRRMDVIEEDFLEHDLLFDTIEEALISLYEQGNENSEELRELRNWMEEKKGVFVELEQANKDFSQELALLFEFQEDVEGDFADLVELIRKEMEIGEGLANELVQVQIRLETAERDIITLSEDKSALEAVKKELEKQIDTATNLALFREDRLTKRLEELEEEFASYQSTAEKDLKSAKTLGMVALALAAVGLVMAFSGM